MHPPILYVVVPCYNEELVLPETNRRLVEKVKGLLGTGKIRPESRILYVDDGSKDQTWPLIDYYHSQERMVSGLKLSRNEGHQNAVFAGLYYAKDRCDCAVSIDADLQDDINVIDGFLDGYADGCDVVFGVRNDRTSDSGFKRRTAEAFYGLMSKLGVESIRNHADCRLLSKRALASLSEFEEDNLYLRGLVPQLGFKQGVVNYRRDARFAGESKYSLKKMLSLALNGITSFSIAPIRLIFLLGLLIAVVCGLLYVIHFFQWIFGAAGGRPLFTTLWFIGSVQLMAIGVVGEYVGKTHLEAKRRPRYFLDVVLDSPQD